MRDLSHVAYPRAGFSLLVSLTSHFAVPMARLHSWLLLSNAYGILIIDSHPKCQLRVTLN